jgi:hypothetical protein
MSGQRSDDNADLGGREGRIDIGLPNTGITGITILTAVISHTGHLGWTRRDMEIRLCPDCLGYSEIHSRIDRKAINGISISLPSLSK